MWLKASTPEAPTTEGGKPDAGILIDALEAHLLTSAPLVDQPLEHLFVPGLYVRKVFNPAGSLVTTKIHKTRHPFVLLSGRLSIWSADDGVQHLTAPYFGVTMPGTRRVIYAHEDSVFVTFHPNPDDGTDLEVIEARLIERRELLEGRTAHEIFNELLAQQLEAAKPPVGVSA